MSLNISLLKSRTRDLARLSREVALLAQIEAHNRAASRSVCTPQDTALADACNHLDAVLGYLESAGFYQCHRQPACLDIIGYDEEIVSCPHCGTRSDFVEAFMAGETGVQLHTCLNQSCQHVYVAAEMD